MNGAVERNVVADDPAEASAIDFSFDGPARMTAGALERWTFRFMARMALPKGARIGVAHRWPSDWGIAQASDPAGVDYFEAVSCDGSSVRWWNARLHVWHPFDHIVFVELPDGLAAGRSVALQYGAPQYGSPGFRVQTFLEEHSPFSLRWQLREDAPWVEIARHGIEVVGAQPALLVVSAPSRVVAGEAFDLHMRVEDEWGNPARLESPLHVDIRDGEDLDDDGEGPDGDLGKLPLIRAAIGAPAWVRVACTLAAPGIHRLAARTLGVPSLDACSNPIEVDGGRQPQPIFWGDLHAQSVIGCGARTIDAYFAHARDFSANHFSSHQANCFLVSRDEWQRTQASTQHHHEAGRFVTFLGVEWSGASPVGGDHNLYFPGDAAELRRCSHEFVADKTDIGTDLRHIEDVYRHYGAADALVAVHVGGRTANLEWHEQALERLLEVHSTHATSEWFLFDALRRGYRMGVIAGSDGVDGRPGNSHPGHLAVRNVRGGLTAIAAPALTRGALWEALQARHCYATTGARILLEFSAGDDVRMGDEVTAGPDFAQRGFRVRVDGTAPLERIDFFRGTQRLHAVDCFAGATEWSNRVRVAWRGLSAQGNWQRARMTWDGELRVEGARIVSVQGWAFDTPDEGLRGHDGGRICWRSVTAGDWDGVVLELDHPDEAELSFVTGPMSFRTRIGWLDPAGRRFHAINPERTVELRRLPRQMPSASFRGVFVDPAPVAGEHAYWVRVRQSDGEQAWSSPIFVGVTGA